MKKVSAISGYLRTIALIIIGLTLSVSTFEYSIQDSIEKKYTERENAPAEQDQQTGTEKQLFLPDYQATLSSFQLHIDQIPRIQVWVAEINFKRTWSSIFFILPESEFFKTLFRHIISPNAP